MLNGYCPECDSLIIFRDEPQEGNRLNCPICDAYLFVVGLHPIKLESVYIDDQIKHGDGEYEP